MASVKSLQKLRSASIHFLEDGGSLLNGVDSLLRELQRFLCEIEDRETAVALKEQGLIEREGQIKRLELQVLEWIEASKLHLAGPAKIEIAEAGAIENDLPEAQETGVDGVPPTNDEVQVQAEITALQEAVTEGLQPTADPEGMTGQQTLRPLPSMLAAAKHRRKKRRH